MIRQQWRGNVPMFPQRRGVLGRVGRVGGTLVLEGDTLRFKPIVPWRSERVVALADVVDLNPAPEDPPRVVLVTSDGIRHVFVIARGRWTTVFDRRTDVSEAASSAIADAISQARSPG
jgi:hypothetical protein